MQFVYKRLINRRPRTIYDIVAEEIVKVELHSLGLTDKDLRALRQRYSKPLVLDSMTKQRKGVFI